MAVQAPDPCSLNDHMKVCAIFNPAARGEVARRFLGVLKDVSAGCALFPTTGAGDARRLAVQAVEAGFETIVAVGGDGTLNEVVHGMATVPDALNRCRLGVVPLGTVNVFARELDLPGDPRSAWQIAIGPGVRQVDLLRFAFPGLDEPTRYALQLAGAGIDARAVELADWNLKRRIGRFCFGVSALKALRERPTITAVHTPDGVLKGRQVFIGNGSLYGGNAVFFPRARPDDGLIHVGVLREVSLNFGVRFAWSLATPWKTSGAAMPFEFWSGPGPIELSVESGARIALQIDGESGGSLPARIELMPAALSVKVRI